MAQELEVDVHVEQAGHHRHAVRVDDRHTGGDVDFPLLSHGHDPVAGHQNDPVFQDGPTEPVDDPSPNQGEGGSLGDDGRSGSHEGGQSDPEDCGADTANGGDGHGFPEGCGAGCISTDPSLQAPVQTARVIVLHGGARTRAP